MFRDRDQLETALEPATVAVIAGRPDGEGLPLNQPPVLASAFDSGAGPGYARHTNPTWEAFERALGELEGGAAVAFGSGMAAAAAAIDLAAPGGRVLVGRSAYVEVRGRLAERARRGLIDLVEVDTLDTGGVIDALDGADLVWLDAISNPALDVCELDHILAAARRAGVLSAVDATLATPLLLQPLELGADLVLHSATKYIGGHSDLMLGVAIARDPRLAARLRDFRSSSGSIPGALETWLALRGLRTLPLRLERCVATAGWLAPRLAEREGVHRVRYPGLSADPAHRAATRVLGGYGAVISFEVRSAATADAVCDAVEVITHASSLGGVETLIDRQARWHAEPAIPDSLLRLSVGCEAREDLWRDLDRALDASVAV